ncbi:hypothetical protein KFE25_012364 [Diacronema lutheri]|uniref:Pseudouridine synthase RsuA/RluA-like domain-containing protein n=1 Tax=Diacronema lutheri TaxID=2081491 RepID=A0A8J5XGX1_DIALT|nr:hypothetical protein KFE25_012364 [Diacronema lutheri]
MVGSRTFSVAFVAAVQAIVPARRGFVEVGRFALRPSAEGLVPVHEALHRSHPDAYPTVTAARRAVRRGLVVLDGHAPRAGQLVSGGEDVRMLGRAGAVASLDDAATDAAADGSGARAPSAIRDEGERHAGSERLEVVYEDDEFGVVVKPQGMPTHNAPAVGSAHTLSAFSLLARSLRPSARDGRLARPRHAHRLDAPTGGLLVVAKTHGALTELSAALKGRDVRKMYVALVARDDGTDRVVAACDLQARASTPAELPPRGECVIPLGGKEAHTQFSIIHRFALGAGAPSAFAELASVELQPITGRTHQLRRHMSALGWPIVGETKLFYASAPFRAAAPPVGLFLWATQLELSHPTTGELMVFRREPPAHFAAWPAAHAAAAATARACQSQLQPASASPRQHEAESADAPVGQLDCEAR